MRIASFFGFVCAALLCGVSQAADVKDDIYVTCIDTTVRNDEWARCGGDLIAREEVKMNAALAKLLAVATDEQVKALKDEQEAWQKYKDSACYFYDTSFGREGQVLDGPICRAEIVAGRTRHLDGYLGVVGDRGK